MKTDNIKNLVFSEIDIKESNFNKNNFTIYSLDILSESENEDINDSSSENSIDIDNYNLEIKTHNELNELNLDDDNNTVCLYNSSNTDETFNTKLFFNNFINSNNYISILSFTAINKKFNI